MGHRQPGKRQKGKREAMGRLKGFHLITFQINSAGREIKERVLMAQVWEDSGARRKQLVFKLPVAKCFSCDKELPNITQSFKNKIMNKTKVKNNNAISCPW